MWHSERHSQERRTFWQKPPSKNPLLLAPDQSPVEALSDFLLCQSLTAGHLGTDLCQQSAPPSLDSRPDSQPARAKCVSAKAHAKRVLTKEGSSTAWQSLSLLQEKINKRNKVEGTNGAENQMHSCFRRFLLMFADPILSEKIKNCFIWEAQISPYETAESPSKTQETAECAHSPRLSHVVCPLFDKQKVGHCFTGSSFCGANVSESWNAKLLPGSVLGNAVHGLPFGTLKHVSMNIFPATATSCAVALALGLALCRIWCGYSNLLCLSVPIPICSGCPGLQIPK